MKHYVVVKKLQNTFSDKVYMSKEIVTDLTYQEAVAIVQQQKAKHIDNTSMLSFSFTIEARSLRSSLRWGRFSYLPR